MKEIAAEIITEIGKLKTKKDHLLIAIDGVFMLQQPDCTRTHVL